jgi:hypothetical protein
MNKKYYCDRSFKEDDDIKWNMLLDYVFPLCDRVNFNILKKEYNQMKDQG